MPATPKEASIAVLCGPAGIGKSRHAACLAQALHARAIVDEWDGRTDIPGGSLVITNRQEGFPANWIVYAVADEAGLLELLTRLEIADQDHSKNNEHPVLPARQPYSQEFYSCSCGAELKDHCICNRDTSRSNTAIASSGEALSSNTD